MQNKKAKEYARLRDEQFSLYENYARQNGINGKFLQVFLWIYNNPQGLTQEFVCKRTYSSKQVVQSIVKNYIRRGWFYLAPVAHDRRKKLIMMTELGQKEIAALLKPLNEYEAQAMSTLSKEQQKALLDATKLFSEAFKERLESHQVTRDAK